MFVTVIEEPQPRLHLITLTAVGTAASTPFNGSAWTAR